MNNKFTTPFLLIVALVGVLLTHRFISESSQLFPSAEAKAEIRMEKLPDFSKIADVKEKKETFFSTLYPIIQEENKHVLKLRTIISKLKRVPVESLSENQQEWLLKIATRYKVKNEVIDAKMFDKLESKVDFVPPSLALIFPLSKG